MIYFRTWYLLPLWCRAEFLILFYLFILPYFTCLFSTKIPSGDAGGPWLESPVIINNNNNRYCLYVSVYRVFIWNCFYMKTVFILMNELYYFFTHPATPINLSLDFSLTHFYVIRPTGRGGKIVLLESRHSRFLLYFCKLAGFCRHSKVAPTTFCLL